jgi:hypothetical protein
MCGTRGLCLSMPFLFVLEQRRCEFQTHMSRRKRGGHGLMVALLDWEM